MKSNAGKEVQRAELVRKIAAGKKWLVDEPTRKRIDKLVMGCAGFEVVRGSNREGDTYRISAKPPVE